MKGKETTVDILDVLQTMFGMQNEQALIELIRKSTSTMMPQRTAVRHDVMKMTNYFTKAKLQRAYMDSITWLRI